MKMYCIITEKNGGYTMNLNASTIVTFLLYFIFMLGIGAYYYTKSKNLSDYILGGRH